MLQAHEKNITLPLKTCKTVWHKNLNLGVLDKTCTKYMNKISNCHPKHAKRHGIKIRIRTSFQIIHQIHE